MKTFKFEGGPLDGQVQRVTLVKFTEQEKISRRGARSGIISFPTIRYVIGGDIFFYRCSTENQYRDSMEFEWVGRWTKKDGFLFDDEVWHREERR